MCSTTHMHTDKELSTWIPRVEYGSTSTAGECQEIAGMLHGLQVDVVVRLNVDSQLALSVQFALRSRYTVCWRHIKLVPMAGAFLFTFTVTWFPFPLMAMWHPGQLTFCSITLPLVSIMTFQRPGGGGRGERERVGGGGGGVGGGGREKVGGGGGGGGGGRERVGGRGRGGVNSRQPFWDTHFHC